LTVVMLIGLWQALRNAREAALPFVLLLLFYPLVFYVTHPEMRYRHIIEPEMLILAASGFRFIISELLRGFPELARLIRRPV
jgi:type III secretory pathway component EscS